MLRNALVHVAPVLATAVVASSCSCMGFKETYDAWTDARHETTPDTSIDEPMDTLSDVQVDTRTEEVRVPPPYPCDESEYVELEIRNNYPRVDVLIVNDFSPSMEQESSFIPDLLRQLVVTMLDPESTSVSTRDPVRSLHLGVISSDMGSGGHEVEGCRGSAIGDDGVLQHSPNPGVPGCESTYPTYLSYESESPDTVVIDGMSSGLACIGTRYVMDGCIFEQPLEAALKALSVHSDPSGPNAGFLRNDSLLAILVISDENDCSVQPESNQIFDPDTTGLGPLDLRCHQNPDLLHPVSRYTEAYRAIRSGVENLAFGFIVGVPPGSSCEGRGTEIASCPEQDAMQETVDPAEPERLEPSCTGTNSEAFPGRRFVNLAMELGELAVVSSICSDDLGWFLDEFTVMTAANPASLALGIDTGHHDRPVAFIDPDDTSGCRCITGCRLLEVLSDDRACPTVKPFIEIIEWDDTDRSLCEIPELGVSLEECGIPGEICETSPFSQPSGDGWYYLPDTGQVVLMGDGVPEPGSHLRIQCCM